MNANSPPRLDRQFWWMLLLAALVILPRSALIATAHSECMDAGFHLRLGLRFITGNPAGMIMAATDPPLGQVLIALPMVATGCYPSAPLHADAWPAGVEMPGDSPPGEPPKGPERAWRERTLRNTPLYGNRLKPETILLLIGIWKAMLFLPCIAVVFQWCRALYGAGSAWLAAGLVTFDPTFAAHIPVVALDSLGVTAIVIACYRIWRYFESGETRRQLVYTAVAIAAAMLIKHTAVVLPGVFLLFGLYYWCWRPWRDGTATLRGWAALIWPRTFTVLLLVLIIFVSMWVLLGFDYSRPMDQCVGLVPDDRASDFPGRDTLFSILENKQVAGTYIGCFVSGWFINRGGQAAMLFDRVRDGGWWYYFPVLATFKVPIGIAIVLLAALASLLRRRWVRGEISLLIPLVCWLALLMSSNMNYSFRHFLPAYVFILMWASRCVMRGLGRAWHAIAIAGLAIAAIDVIRWHPDYMSYVNFPRDRIQYQITDSNLDWGQGIRQVPTWLARHGMIGRTVRILPRWDGAGVVVPYWSPGIQTIERSKPPPTDGVLIISPVWACGVYDAGFNPYDFLRELTPVGWVGRSMLVYDLDRDHDLAVSAIARQKARQAAKVQQGKAQQEETTDAGARKAGPDHPPGDDR